MTAETPHALAGELAGVLQELSDALEPLRDAAAALHRRASGRPDTAALGELAPLVADVLAAHEPLVAGAGYVPAPGVLADRSRWLEWWTCSPGAEPTPLRLDDAPSFDYVDQPWYEVPATTGRRHLTGPYVDYFCTDDYTLTLTLPVTSDGREFLGVVGVDVFVGSVERLVLPRLRALGRPAALVNARGRVVVSTSVREVTGSLVRTPDVAGLWNGRATGPEGSPVSWCGDFPLGLLVAGA